MSVLSILRILVLLTLVSPLLAAQETETLKGAGNDFVFTVSPKYPEELQSAGVKGDGIFKMQFDYESGRVTNVSIVRGTGNELLNRNAIVALKQWRAKPRRFHSAQIPISFVTHSNRTTQSGASHVSYATSEQILAMFTTKYQPDYPYEARRAHMQGRGLFRMYIDENGTVTKLGVIRSTGYYLLDVNACGALIHWKARPGSRRQIDMPVGFSVNPGSYPSKTAWGPIPKPL